MVETNYNISQVLYVAKNVQFSFKEPKMIPVGLKMPCKGVKITKLAIIQQIGQFGVGKLPKLEN